LKPEDFLKKKSASQPKQKLSPDQLLQKVILMNAAMGGRDLRKNT
jgi:hypothetical protein